MRRVLIHDAERGASALLVPAFMCFSCYLLSFSRFAPFWFSLFGRFISGSPVAVPSYPAVSGLPGTKRPARRQLLRVGFLRGFVVSIAMLSVFVNESVFAAVTFRGAATAASTGSTIGYGGDGAAASRNNCGSITPALPAGIVSGDLLIATVTSGAQPTLAMAGWSTLFLASSTTTETAAIYWRVATGSDSNTITQSGTCNVLIARISRFTGVDTSQPFQTAPLAAGNYSYQNAATVTSGSVTTTFSGAMVVFTAHSTDDDTYGALTGFTQAYNSTTTTGNDAAIALYYATQATAGTAGPYSVTKNRGSDPNHGTVFALRPAAPTLSINRPAGTVTGDVMMASVTINPSAVTITPPVGWTLIRETVQGSATTSRLATYYRVAGVGEPASYVWSFSASHAGAAGGITSFSGVDNVTPFDAEAGSATASALAHAAPSVTTTLTNGMLLTAHAYASSGTWTPPGGMTEAVDVASLTPNNASGISLEMNYEVRPTAGTTGTRTATASANADRGATQSISLKPLPLICYTDNFNRADGPPGPDWDASHVSGTFGDPVIFNNRLRMTNASGGAATRATLQRLFPAAGNRIEVEFDDFAYGGSGADGIAITFSDAAVTPVAGAFGGSLGYAQKSNPGSDCTVPGGCPGFAGGWLGVGIDEYGNFSNPTEGRSGGPGQRADAVTVRGSGSGMTGYLYHTTTGTLTPGIDQGGATPAPGYRYRIIIDHSNSTNAFVSVERDTGSGYTTLISPYDAKAQAGQANVPISWLLSYTGSTGGATNIHEIDNLSVCAATQTPISGIHHFDITVSPTLSTCQATTVTITAKDVNNNTLTGYTGAVSILTSSSHGDWFGAVNGTLDNGASYPPGDDNGAATYTFVPADNGAVTLSFWNTHADDLAVIVTDPTVPSSSTTSATMSFRNSGFVVVPSPAQSPTKVIAGRPQNFAVTLTGAGCAPDTNYTGNKNLDVWLTRDPLDPNFTNPTPPAPTISGVSVPTGAPASNPGSNNLTNVPFAGGVATLTLATTDVGRYVLNVRDDTRLYANAVDLGGASSSITVGPWLYATVAGNPGNNSSGGAVLTSAGTSFSATVRGIQWQAADDLNNDGVPDVGANLSNNPITPSYAWATTLSSASPYTPAAGTLGTLANGGIAQASFSGGSATTTAPYYNEVGSFTIQATATDYLNASGSGVDFSTAFGVVGRFQPAYFDLSFVPGCPAGAFTYGGVLPAPSIAGQPFSVTVTARTVQGATPANYHSAYGFAKDTTISIAGNATGLFNNTLTAAVGANGFSNGTATTDTINYRFAAKETAPLTPSVFPAPPVTSLRAVDADTPSVSSVDSTGKQVDIRSGRVQLQNAFGSELVALSMPVQVQYFKDTTAGWVLNGADSCTSIASIALSSPADAGSPKTLSPPGSASIAIKAPASNSTATLAGTVPSQNVSFTAPNGAGYCTVTPDLSAQPWLRYDWDGNGIHDNDPSGRATFGIFRGSPRNIYLRERY
jgi:MSHA biogenesis protein MshQ